jgi:hypothetical protein
MTHVAVGGPVHRRLLSCRLHELAARVARNQLVQLRPCRGAESAIAWYDSETMPVEPDPLLGPRDAHRLEFVRVQESRAQDTTRKTVDVVIGSLWH